MPEVRRADEAGRGRRPVRPGGPPLRRRAALLSLALAPLALRGRTAAAAPVALRVATDPYDAYAEPYYAQDLGFFKRAGLDVEVLTFGNGAAITSALAAGSAQIGISNPIQLANAIAHGIPFRLIAGGGMYTATAPTTLLCVAKGAALAAPRDLDGKTIAISALKSTDEGALKEWLGRNGASAATMRIVELPFSEMGAALARGTLDAAMIAEPALEGALRAGQVRVFGKPFDAVAPRFLIGAWFATDDFVRANPDVVRTFVATIYRTARWANANQDASAQILNKYTKISLDSTKNMTRIVYSETITAGLMQPMLDLAYKYRVLQTPVAAAGMIARSS